MLQQLGVPGPVGDGNRRTAPVARIGDWYVSMDALGGWAKRLRAAVEEAARNQPLDPTLSVEGARALAGVPDRALMPAVAAAAGLAVSEGRVGLPGRSADLGGAETGLRAVEQRLRVVAVPGSREA